MKYRVSFVTNSSDSSFIISKACLTPIQIDLIRNHIEVARGLLGKLKDEEGEPISFGAYDGEYSDHDAWSITEDGEHITCDTYMDNFDMERYLIYIGVKGSDIQRQ